MWRINFHFLHHRPACWRRACRGSDVRVCRHQTQKDSCTELHSMRTHSDSSTVALVKEQLKNFMGKSKSENRTQQAVIWRQPYKHLPTNVTAIILPYNNMIVNHLSLRHKSPQLRAFVCLLRTTSLHHSSHVRHTASHVGHTSLFFIFWFIGNCRFSGKKHSRGRSRILKT